MSAAFSRWVRTAAGTLARNSKFVISAAVGCLIIAGFIYDINTHRVFINEIEFQGVEPTGFTKASLLSSAIDQMRASSLRRLAAVRAQELKVLEVIDQRFPGRETARVCKNTISPVQLGTDPFLFGVGRALISSQAFDAIVTLNSRIPVRELAFFVRSQFGRVPRQLTPILYRDGSQFVIKVIPSPSIVSSVSRKFDHLEEAELALSEILADFLAPVLPAIEKQRESISDAGSVAIARDFLQDKQTYLFTLAIAGTPLLEGSPSYASRHFLYLLTESMNQHILDEMDFEAYGDFGPILEMALALRVAQAEYARQESEHKEVNLDAIFSRYLGKYVPKLERSTAGNIYLSIVDIQFGLMDDFHKRVKLLMTEDVLHATGGAISKELLIAVWMGVLMDTGSYDEAMDLSSSVYISKPGFLVGEAGKAWAMFLAFRAGLHAYDGKLDDYDNLRDNEFKIYPCVEYAALSGLLNIIKKRGRKPELDQLALRSFAHLGEYGIGSFEFFNNWGNALTAAGEYQDAMNKFSLALRYGGDDEWALLNWGLAALRKGDFKTAREKYLDSLAKGTIPNAVYGLLDTVGMLGLMDAAAYLDQFERYNDLLKDADYRVRGVYEEQARIFACRLKRPAPTSILRAGESAWLKTFDPTVCKFLP